ncbi:DUF6207 family protein [Streptomyces sp. NPDC052644]
MAPAPRRATLSTHTNASDDTWPWRRSRARQPSGPRPAPAPPGPSPAGVGLVVLDIAAADETAAHTVMDALPRLWATSGSSPVRHAPSEPGIRARSCYGRRRGGGPACRGAAALCCVRVRPRWAARTSRTPRGCAPPASAGWVSECSSASARGRLRRCRPGGR